MLKMKMLTLLMMISGDLNDVSNDETDNSLINDKEDKINRRIIPRSRDGNLSLGSRSSLHNTVYTTDCFPPKLDSNFSLS